MTGLGQASHLLTLGNASGSRIRTNEGWGGYAGLSLNATSAIQLNIQYGYADPGCNSCAGYDWGSTVHSNILWRPVDQIRLGWELMYGWKRNTFATASLAGRRRNEDALRGQFGAWFFF